MSEAVVVTEKVLDTLRKELADKCACGEMSEKRFAHTIEVENMARRLAALYVPDKANMLRAAALLHDLTKEYSYNLHLKICAEYDIDLTEYEAYSPKTLHQRTAALLIPEKYPELASDELLGCVRWHTTGRAGMTLCEKLIYLADYIDMSRNFEDCVALRKYFFSRNIEEMSDEEKTEHLDDTLLISFDMTIKGLLEKGAIISPETIAARNELALIRIKQKK